MEIKKNRPMFSVIVPTHNGASHDFFRKCLHSIAHQTFRDFELIVIADKCTDNTAEVARQYGATVYELATETEVKNGERV